MTDSSSSVEIASTYFPAGMSWLLNVLLELDIGCYKGDRPEDLWSRTDSGWQIRDDSVGLQKHCPAVVLNKSFIFSMGHGWVRWSHDWPSQRHDQSKLIFFVRDPRDTLFSQFKRTNTGGSFKDFLHEPLDPLPFSNLVYLQMFSTLWMLFLRGMPHLLIRFEDVKENPRRELVRVLEFLNLPLPSESALGRAIESSSFQAAKAGEEKIDQQRPNTFPFQANRSGTPYEYKKHFTAEMLSSIGPGFDSFCAEFGYELHDKALERTFESQNALSRELDGFIFSCIESIDTQPKLSMRAKDLLKGLLWQAGSAETLWPVVAGKQVLPMGAGSLRVPTFVEFQRLFLAVVHQAKSKSEPITEANALAKALLPLAPSQKLREYFIHRWMVLTGEYLGP